MNTVTISMAEYEELKKCKAALGEKLVSVSNGIFGGWHIRSDRSEIIELLLTALRDADKRNIELSLNNKRKRTWAEIIFGV